MPKDLPKCELAQAATAALDAARQDVQIKASDQAKFRDEISALESELVAAQKRLPEIETEKKRAAASKVIQFACLISYICSETVVNNACLMHNLP